MGVVQQAGIDLGYERRPGESIIRVALLCCAAVTVATTIGIVASLAVEAARFFQLVTVAEFLFGTRWAPTFAPPSFGMLPLLNATVMITLIGMAVALPLGLALAIYLSEYAHKRTRRVLKPILELLAGIPTVVFGYFALTFLTPNVLQPLVPGTNIFNALAAGLAVGIMILPMVASLSEDAMRAVPSALREGALALGATRRVTAARVVVPAAFSGISAAALLALSRGIGETMIVAIAAGQLPQISADPRDPMQTMTAYIVQVSLGDTPAGSTAHLTIFALGATLFLITFVLNVIAVRIVRRFREQYE